MSTQHTPGPWQPVGAAIVNEHKLCLRVSSPHEELDTAAVARDLARALNAHDALLAALRDAYAHVALLASGQQPRDSNAEMCQRLGDVIAKAAQS